MQYLKSFRHRLVRQLFDVGKSVLKITVNNFPAIKLRPDTPLSVIVRSMIYKTYSSPIGHCIFEQTDKTNQKCHD